MSMSSKTVLDMTSEEFETACRLAVANRDDSARMDYTAVWDEETGNLVMLYADKRGCCLPVIGEKG